MLNPSSNHLRLHIEDPWVARTGLDLPAWRPLQKAYLELTGWQLDCTPGSLPARSEPIATLPELFGTQEGALHRQRVNDQPDLSVREQAARDLAQGLAGVLIELQTTRLALQHREAELATAIPVVARPHESSDFNHRLQAVLRGTVEGLGGQAAALYLLDDTTSELKLRAQWGLSSLRFLEPARPLRGAVADLEALTGHAVVLEDTQQLPHWNVPEAFASAVCVPVSSPDTLLGTLWFFADQVRDYRSEETQLLEIIAGRLAAELERRVLIDEAAQSQQARDQAAQVIAWHHDRSRPSPPLVEGWQVAGVTVTAGRPRGDFHLWRLGDQDELWLASAAVGGPPVKSMLGATLLQGAMQASLLHPDSPRRIVQGLNDVLWTGAAGGDGSSVFCGRLDPASGQIDYATAGATDAYILRPHGWEPIVVDGLALGNDPAWDGPNYHQEIHPGDILLVFSDRHLTRSDHPTDVDTTCLAEALLRHMHLSARNLAEMASQLISQQCADAWARSVLIVKRTDSSATR